MRSKLVAGNWKMHGSLAENEALLGGLKSGWAAAVACECAVCVPFPYLDQVRAQLQGGAIAWGAQDLSEFPKGAYTGEVSAHMLREFGCRYVIVGHSERRAMHAEDSRLVARKVKAAQLGGLTPIVCVGETLAQRESGVTDAVVKEQLVAVIDEIGVAAVSGVVIAYEPVWAIGTGKTATPAQAQAVHATIRAEIAGRSASVAASVKILYGGSVKAASAAELFAMADIDGGLVGGASLDSNEFLAICRAGTAAAR